MEQLESSARHDSTETTATRTDPLPTQADPAIREVVYEHVIFLDPRRHKEFLLEELPPWIALEPDHDKITEMWTRHVRSAVYQLCRMPWNPFAANRHGKQAIFRSGVQNICRDFSRRTRNVKLSLEVTNERKNKNYRLRLIKLSDVPDSILNTTSIVAEIPVREYEVEASYVGIEPTTAEVLQSGPVVASAEVLYSDGGDEERVVSLHLPAASSDVPPAQSSLQRPALERMQELESIKQFLSESEYQAKRRDILDFI